MSYPTTFRTYIQRTIVYALAEVQNCPNLLPEEIREQALHTLEYGLDFEDGWEMVRDLLLAMAPKMELSGVRDTKWIELLSEGLLRSKTKGNEWTTGNLAVALGMLYRFLSDFPQSRQLLEEAVAQAKLSGDALLTAQALNELAWVEKLQHRYVEAKAYAKEALTLSSKNAIEHGMSLRVLGMVAYRQKKFERAEVLHRAAHLIFQENQDARKSAWALQNLGLVLHNQKRFNEALGCFQQAADMLYQIHDLYNWTIAKTNLGVAYSKLGMHEAALLHLKDAEKQASQSNLTLQWANVSNSLGLVHLELKRIAAAEQSFQNAISLFRKLGDDEWRINNLDGLSMVYLEQKQFGQAQLILESALAELYKIERSVNYDYLKNSLTRHLQEAKRGQDPTDG